MANITVPIQVNLPDDWVDQIVNRLRNDPDADWVDVTRCKDCKFYRCDGCFFSTAETIEDGFCYWAERKDAE